MARLVVGIDEAGYGPRLGPLVVCGVGLRVPDAAAADGRDLWKRLEDCVLKPRKPTTKKRRRHRERIPVGDSKLIYTASAGPAELERAVLALVGWLAGGFEGVDGLLARLRGGPAAIEDPWEEPRWGRFPLAEDTTVPTAPLQPARGDVTPVFVETRTLSAARFNASFDGFGNKALVTWTAVATLLRTAWEKAGEDTVTVIVDRQGGRTHYGSLLGELIPRAFVWTLHESPDYSAYRLMSDGRQMEIEFRVAADARSWPVAVASMISKYVRELMMARLNGFFAEHAPEVRGTAGYYGDASRFLEETAAVRSKLGISDARFVRAR